jgi:hypothetical protein
MQNHQRGGVTASSDLMRCISGDANDLTEAGSFR